MKNNRYKQILAAIVIASMVFAASCSKDEVNKVKVEEETVTTEETEEEIKDDEDDEDFDDEAFEDIEDDGKGPREATDDELQKLEYEMERCEDSYLDTYLVDAEYFGAPEDTFICGFVARNYQYEDVEYCAIFEDYDAAEDYVLNHLGSGYDVKETGNRCFNISSDNGTYSVTIDQNGFTIITYTDTPNVVSYSSSPKAGHYETEEIEELARELEAEGHYSFTNAVSTMYGFMKVEEGFIASGWIDEGDEDIHHFHDVFAMKYNDPKTALEDFMTYFDYIDVVKNSDGSISFSGEHFDEVVEGTITTDGYLYATVDEILDIG
ncbi:MAG: hypothetical protein J6U54_07440 [Clostridiales bacterium]|nr:hypothetical protein [Clostridiales bacterium]